MQIYVKHATSRRIKFILKTISDALGNKQF